MHRPRPKLHSHQSGEPIRLRTHHLCTTLRPQSTILLFLFGVWRHSTSLLYDSRCVSNAYCYGNTVGIRQCHSSGTPSQRSVDAEAFGDAYDLLVFCDQIIF